MTLNLARQQKTISALFLLRAYRACQLLGARRPPLLKAMELEEAQLRDPLKYVDPTKLTALFQATAEEMNSRHIIANIAENMAPAGFSDPGFLAMFETSYGVALQKAIRAQRLGNNIPVFRLENDSLGDYVVWQDEACQSDSIMHLGFAIIVESLRTLSDDSLHDIRNLCLSHSRPKNWDASYLHFGNDIQIPISFDQPQNRIEFRSGFFLLANPNANPSIVMESNEQRSSERWKGRPYAKSCYDYLVYLLDKPGPNLDSAAETFAMAERTLRRKLVAEDTSFREILELVRRDICQLYFLEGKRQLSDISTLLGYSELSAFTRAYTGWYGHPPSKDASNYAKLAA